MPPSANDPTYRLLVFGAATSGGVLLAIVVQVVLAQLGLDLAAIWRAVGVPRAAQLRAATAWWLIAGIAFMAGFAIAALVRYLVANQSRVRGWLGWVGGLFAVTGLSWVGREATSSDERIVAPPLRPPSTKGRVVGSGSIGGKPRQRERKR